jgi:hypothetical protein
MAESQEYGLCQKCLSPLKETERYDMEAAKQGEIKKVKEIHCEHCETVLLSQFVEFMRKSDPNYDRMCELLEQGVPMDELPTRLPPEQEESVERLLRGIGERDV